LQNHIIRNKQICKLDGIINVRDFCCILFNVTVMHTYRPATSFRVTFKVTVVILREIGSRLMRLISERQTKQES